MPVAAARASERSERTGEEGEEAPEVKAALRRIRRRGADWVSPTVVLGLLRIADGAVVLLAGVAAHLSRFGDLASLAPVGVYGLISAVLLTAHGFQLAGLYEFGRVTHLGGQARRLAVAWAVTVMCLVALAFATKTGQDVSRLWVGLWFVYGLGGLVAVRLGVRLAIRRWQRAGRLTRTLVVAGAGVHGRRLVEHLRRTADPAVRLIGLFDDRRDRVPDYVAGYPVLGTLDDLLRFAREQPIDQVVVALPWDAEGRLLAWLKRLRDLPVDVRLCPDAIGFHLAHRGVTHVGGVPLLNVFERPLSGWSYVAKALEDRLLAAAALALAAPLMLIIALAVRLDSPGPALFRQRRYGFNNEVIEVVKFRTMRVDAAAAPAAARQTGGGGGEGEEEVRQAVRDDPRVTRVGWILRRTSLDELPQLFNVLRGEMSVVGPRPHAVSHNERYARLIDAYLGRHRVKPGITGWAQVNGLRGETETLAKMERRVQYDLYYIEHWSLLLDLRILARTLFVGFAHPNAY